MELRYRCAVCSMETVNPTRVHVCPVCSARVCSSCLAGHRAEHEGAPPAGAGEASGESGD